MRHFKYISIQNSIIFVLTLLLLLFLLTPMLIVARYDVPSADDFSFSCETHAAVLNRKGFLSIITGAFEKVQDVYLSWQGTFSAVFMMAFQPSIWGFHFYFLTTWIMLFSLVGGVFFLCFRVFSDLFHAQKDISGIISSIVAIMYTQFVPMPNQSFYWYNGSVYYTFTFGLMLIMYAIYIGYFLHNGSWRIIILCLLSILIGGSNYVTALLSTIISLLIIFFSILKKDKKWKVLIAPFFFLITSFIISIFAPGNAVRQSTNSIHPTAVQAIFLSFHYAMQNAVHWADLRFFSCIVFLLPFLWQAAASSSNKQFRYPFVITVLSVCLYSASFTPHIYALSSDGPDRLKNIIYFFFVLLFIFNVFWWFGWISHKKENRIKTDSVSSTNFLSLFLFSASAFVCLFFSIFFFHGSLTSVLAINELRTGEAQAYYSEASERQLILEDPTILDCEFDHYNNIPYLLYFTDMSDDPSDFQNEDTCTYYNKNSIIVR